MIINSMGYLYNVKSAIQETKFKKYTFIHSWNDIRSHCLPIQKVFIHSHTFFKIDNEVTVEILENAYVANTVKR